MKIKYVPLPGTSPDAWLKEGASYIVLAVFSANDGTRYRIISGEAKTPALHPAKMFEIISPRIPSSWIVSTGTEKGFFIELAPAKWSIPGFWEKFFDQDVEAVRIFEEESYKIVIEED